MWSEKEINSFDLNSTPSLSEPIISWANCLFKNCSISLNHIIYLRFYISSSHWFLPQIKQKLTGDNIRVYSSSKLHHAAHNSLSTFLCVFPVNLPIPFPRQDSSVTPTAWTVTLTTPQTPPFPLRSISPQLQQHVSTFLLITLRLLTLHVHSQSKSLSTVLLPTANNPFHSISFTTSVPLKYPPSSLLNAQAYLPLSFSCFPYLQCFLIPNLRCVPPKLWKDKDVPSLQHWQMPNMVRNVAHD